MSDPITEGLAANVLRLGNEVRDLSISNAVLRQDNERLKAEVEALRKELADAQENYHLVNEMVARLRKEGNQP